MAASIDDLVPELKIKVQKLLDRCTKLGVSMRPYQAIRTPFEQAKLWRQSRSKEEINAKITEFKNAGADFLAFCLESVGPQHGDPVTKALPGLSWHQWGEAVDCFWLVNNKAEWSSTKKINGINGYRVYANEAQKLGLTAGGLWTTFKDWPHVQLSSAGNPQSNYSLVEINNIMNERFG